MELPPGWEMGTVKFFGPRKDVFGGLYGFLVLSDGTEVFFHANTMGAFVKGPEGVAFVGSLDFSMEARRHPKKGDKIVFRSLYDKWMPWRSPKADPWGFADEFERIQKQIVSRHTIVTATT